VFAFITGKIESKHDQSSHKLVLEVGGIGYELEVSSRTFRGAPDVGEVCRLETHFHVRDDAQLLFGFIDRAELSVFRLITRVSGFGPKTALALLSAVEPGDFVALISSQDIRGLVALPGVGKKSAERLIIELKDLVSKIEAVPAGPFSDLKRESVAALMALGYGENVARSAIDAVIDEKGSQVKDSSGLIRFALQHLSRG